MSYIRAVSSLDVCRNQLYILNTPNLVSSMGAFKAALKLSPKTLRESTGSITPSSHILALEKYGLPSASNLWMIGSLSAFSSSGVQSLPSLLRCSAWTVAKTEAACSPPITEMRELGHMYRNRGP